MLRGFSASSAHRWVPCPASVLLSQPFLGESSDSEAAKEGTAAHWVAEQIFKNRDVAIGDEAPNGVKVTEEMVECGQQFVDLVPSCATVEKGLKMPQISERMKGMPDAYFVNEDENTVEIYDYKFGHAPVNAFENWQMLVECAAFVDESPEAFKLTVYQPRCYVEEPVKTWVLGYEDFMNDYLPRLQAAAKEAESDNPKAHPGDQCKYCPAAHACSALRDAALGFAEYSKTAFNRELEGDSLGYELKVLSEAEKMIASRKKSLEEQALSQIEEGRPVLGFTKAPNYGRTTWNIDYDSLFTMAELAGVDIKKPAQPVTPNQAVKAGLDKRVVDSLSAAPFKGHKLKPVDLKTLKGVFKNEH